MRFGTWGLIEHSCQFALRRGGLLTAKKHVFLALLLFTAWRFSAGFLKVCLSVLHTRVEKMSSPEMRECFFFPFEVYWSAMRICHLAPHPWLRPVEREDGEVEKFNKWYNWSDFCQIPESLTAFCRCPSCCVAPIKLKDETLCFCFSGSLNVLTCMARTTCCLSQLSFRSSL